MANRASKALLLNKVRFLNSLFEDESRPFYLEHYTMQGEAARYTLYRKEPDGSANRVSMTVLGASNAYDMLENIITGVRLIKG